MEKLNDLHAVLGSLEKFPVRQKELERNISERDNFLITSIEQNSLKMIEEIEKIAELNNAETTVEEDLSNLNQILAEIDIDEFSRKHNSLREGHKEVITECEKFMKQTQKEEENILSGAESCYKNHLLSVSQDMESVNMSIAEMRSSLEESVHLQKNSDKDKSEEIQKHVQKVNNDVTESQGAQLSVCNQLKDVFQKMDFELKTFIPDGLVKDVPTGTTPQRKNYTYPRILTATSPHDRILERYRSKLVADTAIAVNLPLNSSFNELEESIVSSNKNTDILDTNNESLSSDDSTSYDTDSCASSVSDASIGKRNKENWKNSKKRSRLPKRFPNKGFLKPALPLKRKPLSVSNSKDSESFAELP